MSGGTRVAALSLFAGAGGLDVGFHDDKFTIRAAVELVPEYAQTIRANIGPGKYLGQGEQVLCGDVREFDPVGAGLADVDIVIGGPPCQTFSAAGRRSGGVLGTDDLRGQLFRSYVDILEATRPHAFVFENVYGLPGANGGRPWREITDAFAGAGYKLFAQVLNAADFGVPQHRERLVMVGVREGDFRFPLPTHGPDSPSGRPFVTAAQAIEGLPEPTEPDRPAGLYGHLLPQIPPGLNYSFLTAEMGHPEPQFAWRAKFHDFLYKADPDAPVRTIKSRPGSFTGPFHWDSRRFTVAELKRLQSFPEDYVIEGSYARVVEQIGNSVPPLLARVVATSVREQIFEQLPASELTYATQPEGFRSRTRQRQRERTEYYKLIAEREIGSLRSGASTPNKLVAMPSKYTAHYYGLQRVVPGSTVAGEGGHVTLEVTSRRIGPKLSIDVAESGVSSARGVAVRIEIAGLERKMGTIASVSVTGVLDTLPNLVQLWAVVEQELVQRSRFFSLVDIYGHYANRGDDISVETVLAGSGDSRLLRACQALGSSTIAGRALSRREFAALVDVPSGACDSLVLELRNMRWDVRSSTTHRTLANDEYVSTYPFPVASRRAQFEAPTARLLQFDATGTDG